MIARQWLRQMSQPFTMEHQRGVSLLTEKMLDQDDQLMEKFRYVSNLLELNLFFEFLGDA